MQKYFDIPLKQHIGSPSVAIVLKGDRVKRGQKIAACNKDSLGCEYHAPVSGLITDITSEVIQIEYDSSSLETYERIKGDSIIDCVKEAGIIGLGGAGFPTHVKLSASFKKPPIILVNAAECEPILQHNVTSIGKDPNRLYKGLKLVMEATGAKEGIVAIKSKNKQAVESLEKIIEDEKIRIITLRDLYPMGEERAIVRECLGILLKVDELPISIDVLVINAETVERIYEAVELKKPLIDKDITIGGLIEGQIKTMKDVPLGTTVEALLETHKIQLKETYGGIIMGGPFMGKAVSLQSPVTKTTGGFIFTMPALKETRKLGLLVCACGANEERLQAIGNQMGAEIVGIEYCKQAIKAKGGYKCENPGICPGQSGAVMKLRKKGAQALLISNCTDCTNTVMSIAPKLNMPVYHCTDSSLRATGHRLIRRVEKE